MKIKLIMFFVFYGFLFPRFSYSDDLLWSFEAYPKQLLDFTHLLLNIQLGYEEQQFFALINHYRAKNGVAGLVLDYRLNESSQWMSQNMADYNYVSKSDSVGRNPSQRMSAFGYHGNHLGENILNGYVKSKEVFTAWKESSGDNANMLCTTFRSIGIGRAFNPNSTYRWYWTADFGDQIN